MKNRKKIIISVFILLILLLFVVKREINELNEVKNLPNPLKELPPSEFVAQYSANILLGGMKAFAIDYLWIKLTEATEEESWETIEALLKMIKTLQPKNADVMIYLGWNQAYNISPYKSKIEEQFADIELGINYLKDALKNIPNNPELISEIARIYYFKIPFKFPTLYYFEEKYKKDPLSVGEEWLLKMISTCEKIGDTMTIDKYIGSIMSLKVDIPFYMILTTKNKSTVIEKLDEAIKYFDLNLKKYAGKAQFGQKMFEQMLRFMQEVKPTLERDTHSQELFYENRFDEYISEAKLILESYKTLRNKNHNIDLDGLKIRMKENLYQIAQIYFKKFDEGYYVEAVNGMNWLSNFVENIYDKSRVEQIGKDIVDLYIWQATARNYDLLYEAILNEFKFLVGKNLDINDWRINLSEARENYKRLIENDYYFTVKIAEDRIKKLEKYKTTH